MLRQIDGKWHTVSKAGKVGKRAYKTEANAQAAQDRGRALLASRDGSSPSGGETEVSPAPLDSMDTSVERKLLGIPAKPAARLTDEDF